MKFRTSVAFLLAAMAVVAAECRPEDGLSWTDRSEATVSDCWNKQFCPASSLSVHPLNPFEVGSFRAYNYYILLVPGNTRPGDAAAQTIDVTVVVETRDGAKHSVIQRDIPVRDYTGDGKERTPSMRYADINFGTLDYPVVRVLGVDTVENLKQSTGETLKSRQVFRPCSVGSSWMPPLFKPVGERRSGG